MLTDAPQSVFKFNDLLAQAHGAARAFVMHGPPKIVQPAVDARKLWRGVPLAADHAQIKRAVLGANISQAGNEAGVCYEVGLRFEQGDPDFLVVSGKGFPCPYQQTEEHHQQQCRDSKLTLQEPDPVIQAELEKVSERHVVAKARLASVAPVGL